jgi:hypothetical protein
MGGTCRVPASRRGESRNQVKAVQIPPRPEGLVGMTKINGLSARLKSCPDTNRSKAEFFSSG